MSLENMTGDAFKTSFNPFPSKKKKFIDNIFPGTTFGMEPFRGKEPTDSPPIPPPVPPVSAMGTVVTDASIAARKLAAKRKGLKSTILAGETDTTDSYSNQLGQTTLLGGG
jgi:hypothetical protein